jgi:hypothetical protein
MNGPVLVLDIRHTSAVAVLDLVDRYARDRRVWGRRPRPLGPVTVDLVADVAGGVRVPRVPPVRLLLTRNPSGYELFFGAAVGPAGTEARLDLAGTHVLRVRSPRYQAAEVTVGLPAPRTAVELALEPGYDYPFSQVSTITGGGQTLLRGTVHRMDGKSVAGTEVEVPAVPAVTNVYRTDDTGRWVLIFPDSHASGPVTVRLTGPDGVVRQVPDVLVERGREHSLGDTAVDGWVFRAGAPVAGAVVRVAGQPGQAVTGNDGSWRYYFDPNQQAVTVAVSPTLPDGRTLPSTAVPLRRRETVAVPPFRFA